MRFRRVAQTRMVDPLFPRFWHRPVEDTIFIDKQSVMMLRVPHASVLRVGVLVWFDAEGFEALLRARRPAFSHV
jgi:hypothetical protein